ncbi:autotransporter outer membrane beta-barrel domain-containing protein [Siphonobacter aquaeclarae]|uniref:TMF family protein n=1 Tax=Siphonobacter aquaeclarae TaxID=563176 RepID=A0A1G9KB32_9BACT|nr:cell division protein ZapB [Siphonobacter aquaeclarae]SDL46776.1 hypothetical protein SAMN04488090_0947 [Siphonobacter aquaeclarae]
MSKILSSLTSGFFLVGICSFPAAFCQNGNYVRNTINEASPGTSNTLLGFDAGKYIGSNSAQSVFLGTGSGLNITQSSADVIIGHWAFRGPNAYSTSTNVVIGGFAGVSATPVGTLNPMSGNTVVGSLAGTSLVGNYNTLFGFGAGSGGGMRESPENRNSFFGAEAGRMNTGRYNTFIGSRAGEATGEALENVFVGMHAGRYSTREGSQTNQNVFVGNESGYYQTGWGNVSIGYQAGYGSLGLSGGSGNVFVGQSAGLSNTFGSRNTYLGYLSPNGPVLQNATAVGANSLVGVSNGLVLGDTSYALVGIGTAYPNQRLTIRGNVSFLTASNLRFGNAPFLDINPNRLALVGEKGTFPVEITSSLRYKVASENQWADYILHPSYTLKPLKEIAFFIRQNGHLPDIPSAAEVVKNGVDAAQMDAKLLAQIEQLTLHAIDQKKENDQLKSKLELLSEELKYIKAQLTGLLNERKKSE